MTRTRLFIAGVVAVLVYAAMAIGAGLDRMTDDDPMLASSVPAPFRINAAREQAALAVAAKQPLPAMTLARTAILRDPANVEAIAQMGLAQLLANQMGGARATYQVTRGMGWREPSTQIYWMLDAIGRKDFADAARRIDAVMRQAPQFPQRDQLLALFEGWPAGRDQLARRLTLEPPWKQAYFDGSTVLQGDNVYLRGEVAKALAAYDRPPRDCARVTALLWELAEQLGFSESYSVWQAYCRDPAARGIVADGGFEFARLEGTPSPFEWRFDERGDIDAILAKEPGFSGKALSATNLAPGRRSFARLAIQAPPGRHVLRWRALGADGQPSGDLTLSVQCNANVHEPLPARMVDQQRGLRAADVVVPPACATQWIDLAVAGGAGPVTVDDITLSPAR